MVTVYCPMVYHTLVSHGIKQSGVVSDYLHCIGLCCVTLSCVVSTSGVECIVCSGVEFSVVWRTTLPLSPTSMMVHILCPRTHVRVCACVAASFLEV